MSQKDIYLPENFSKKEEEMMRKFHIQLDDAKKYFLSCIKPRLDRSYKLYVAYNGDRGKEIQSWQSNVFVPYINGVVETLMPRILDARPDFTIQGRNTDDQPKANKIEQLTDYTWEISQMDDTSEAIVRSSLVYGIGYLQASYKKDIREHHFLKTKNINNKKQEWVKKEQVFYDAPYAEWVDNYCLWYDWHNIPAESKQFWFKRLLLPGSVIKRRYPMHDPKRLKLAFDGGSGDLTDHASIRNEVKTTHDKTTKGAERIYTTDNGIQQTYEGTEDPDVQMFEVFEWWRPFDDKYSVHVGGSHVPIFKKACIPIPYDFKEAPFVSIPFLKLPGEFEGMGIPILLENPQVMLNLVKNQRLDAATLNIHKMWIINPMANINKRDLVVKPFGIIYSTDPQGVREVQFSDIKPSAYREEELLKSDMRYASGVDDFSMGTGGGAGSATEVRHLRESTLERVRLFINHLGSGYAKLMRFWISMYRQFYTKPMTIRVVGDDGEELFPLVEKDDLMGEFDYKASVIPSIAGQMDVEKKQGMDLFQLLINLPFIDPKKLTSQVLHNWGWSIDSIAKEEASQQMAGTPEQQGQPPSVDEQMAMMMGGAPQPQDQGAMLPNVSPGDVSPEVAKEALAMLGGGQQGNSSFSQAAKPINLLESGDVPPTAPSIKGGGANLRGLNRGGKVNTNISREERTTPEGNIANQSQNIQK